MRRCLLYEHGGSANHGCEALVRTTCELLDLEPSHTTLLSYDKTSDEAYGVDLLCDVWQYGERKSMNRVSPHFWRAYSKLKVRGDGAEMNSLVCLSPLRIRRGDVAIHIGGDNYCYDGLVQLLMAHHRFFRCHGLRTVLWGCSIDPELLEKKEVARDIALYDVVTVRESISYEAIRKVNRNAILVSDPAFSLHSTPQEFFDAHRGTDFVGVNYSSLSGEYETVPGIARTNVSCLIERILAETNMEVLLIPHVVLRNNDDREALRFLYNRYEVTGRIHMVPNCGCEDLKGYISGCRFFVGARTHATIAAYSSLVPTLVLGYSVKSRGIARDLFGTDEGYVVPVQDLLGAYDLVDAFWHLQNCEQSIRRRLESVMPEYKQRSRIGVEAVRRLLA